MIHYTDLRDITDGVSDARVFGGIHFRFDQDAGDRMGTDIGRYNNIHRLQKVDDDDDYDRVNRKWRPSPTFLLPDCSK